MLHVYIDSLKKSAVKKIDTKIKEYLSENINIYYIIYYDSVSIKQYITLVLSPNKYFFFAHKRS